MYLHANCFLLFLTVLLLAFFNLIFDNYIIVFFSDTAFIFSMSLLNTDNLLIIFNYLPSLNISIILIFNDFTILRNICFEIWRIFRNKM